MDFLGDQSNSVTRNGNNQVWRDNVRRNRKHFCAGNPDLTGLTAYIVCPGPSLENNVDLLKGISKRGVIVCVDAALRYVLQKGIKPEYCVMIDGSEKMLKMIEGCDTSGITLICTPSVSPSALDLWRGPKFFVGTPNVRLEKKYDHFHLTRIVKMKRDMKAGEEIVADEDYEVEFEGVKVPLMTGGNVSTAAHNFATHLLKAQQVVFVGLDLSWTYESHHYAGHEHMDNVRDRTKHVAGSHFDSNGKKVYTNLSLLAFKRWHEQMAKIMNGSVVNATEGGILGIGQEGEKYDYVEFLRLDDAISKYTPNGKERK